MQCYTFCVITFLAIIIKNTTPACTTKPNSAVVVALLPLHSGSNCTLVELRGLQQAAALRAVSDSINTELKRETSILMNIKFQDTCSSEDGAIKAALKSMVDSDQTCLHPPFFMGFIGPENKMILDPVHQITKLFNATHVVPYSEDSPVDLHDNSILHVTTRSTHNQAQSIVTILHQLEWTTISLAVTDSLLSQKLAKDFIEMIQKDLTLCIINNVARITNDSSINQALTDSQGHGIVIIADSIEIATKVLEMNKALAVPIVLSMSEIGLQSWQLPFTNSTLIVLQETISQPFDGLQDSMNASMYRTYMKQQDQFKDIYCKYISDSRCSQSITKDMINSLDTSVLPISYAARLMGSALISAHKTKCRDGRSETPIPGLCSEITRMASEEWRSIVHKSSAFSRSNQGGKLPIRIRFQMDIGSASDIYMRNQISTGLEKIGQITNGNKLKLLDGLTFPSYFVDLVRMKQPVCPDNENLKLIPTMWTLPSKERPNVQLEPVERKPEEEFYNMVTLLCGAGLCILMFFLVVTYIVYSSFKVKTEKQSSAGSPSIQRKPSRIARWRRGSGQSSRASIRTID